MSRNQKVIAYLRYSVNVDCPHRRAEIDLLDGFNDEGEISIPIFNNEWEALKGHGVRCPKYSKRFELESIEG